MSTDDRKVSLSSSVDPTGAREGIQQIKQELGTLPGAAQQAAQGTSAPLDKMGADAEKASKKVEASTRSLVSQIQRQDAALASGGKNTAAYFETIAKQRGLDTAVLTPYLNQLRETERAQLAANKALDGTGMSAKATAAALRQVPAQFTDIVTALASGQQPLTVLLQQGGQLKDAFGGVGNAAKALAGYVVGLVNPFTLVAGAAAGLSIAAYQGSQELPAFQKQLILSGQAAGVTASQLAAARNAAAELSGATKGRAADVLASIASSAGIGAANLTRFTAAALAFERAGGDAAEKTADAFKALATDPLNAALKLNDTTAFLTRSTYEQIKALTDQGRVADAAKVAQEAYFQAVSDKIPALEKNLGSLQVAWRGVKDFAASAWGAMLNVGREDTLDTQIQKMQKAMAANQKWINAGLFAGSLGQANADFQSQIDALTQQKRLDDDSARAKAEQAKQVKLLAEYQKDNVRYLTNEEQLRLAIKQATEEGVAAGAKQEDLQRRIAALRQQFDPRLYEEEISAAETQRNEAIKRSVIEINALRAAGRINDFEGITRLAQADRAAMESEKTALKQQLGYASQRMNSEKEVSQLQTQIAAVSERQLTREKQLQADLLALQQARKTAMLQFYEAQAQDGRDDEEAYARREYEARQQLELAIDANAESLKNEAGQLRLEASLLGASSDVRDRALAQYRIELDLKRQIDEIDKSSPPNGEADREELRAKARAQAAQAMLNAQQRATLDSWRRTTDDVASGLTDALMRGFESGKGFAQNFRDTLKNMFSTLVLRPIVEPIFRSVAGSLMSLVGGRSGGGLSGFIGGGGSGMLGGLGSLISGAGNLFGSSTLGAFGTGFGLTGSQASAAAGAYNAAGMAGTGSALTAGSSIASAIPVVGAIIAGMGLANSAFSEGFSEDNLPWTKAWLMTGGIAPPTLKFDTNLLEKLGVSDRVANIITGASLWSKAFGRGPKTVQETGIVGSIGDGDASGQTYADWKKKGGWFSSNKYGTDYSALDGKLEAALDKSSDQLLTQTTEWAKALGLPADVLSSVTTKFKAKLTGDAQADAEAIQAVLDQYQAALTGQFESTLKPFQQAGEELTDTLKRLVGIETFSQSINELGGVFTRLAHSSVDVKQSLLDLVGGADKFIQMANGYVSNYYSRDEIAGLKAGSIKEALAGVGITQDFSADDAKSQFRALVDQTDVSTEAGQKRLAALLGIQGDFANLSAYLSETGLSLSDVATQAPAFDALAPLLANGTTQQVGAINEVRDAIISLQQTVKDTAKASSSTTATKAWIEVGVAR